MSMTKEKFTKMGTVRRALFVEKADPVAYKSLYALHGHLPTAFANRLYNLGLQLIANLDKSINDPLCDCAECKLGHYTRCLKLGFMRKDKEKQQKKFSNVLASDVFKSKTIDTGASAYKRCAHSHPAMPIKDGITIQGGSAHDPVSKDFDIFISLDSGKDSDVSGYPWNPGQFIFFPITDMSVPKDVGEFKKMIEWTAVQLIANKSVHVGCIGGHGRTGLFLAALYKYMTGDVDAITYVRKNYCDKAVESNSQIDFLNQHYGITKVKGFKSWDTTSIHSGTEHWYDKYPKTQPKQRSGYGNKYNDRFEPSGDDISVPMEPIIGQQGNIWGCSE